jgi:hypothetical protein
VSEGGAVAVEQGIPKKGEQMGEDRTLGNDGGSPPDTRDLHLNFGHPYWGDRKGARAP